MGGRGKLEVRRQKGEKRRGREILRAENARRGSGLHYVQNDRWGRREEGERKLEKWKRGGERQEAAQLVATLRGEGRRRAGLKPGLYMGKRQPGMGVPQGGQRAQSGVTVLQKQKRVGRRSAPPVL